MDDNDPTSYRKLLENSFVVPAISVSPPSATGQVLAAVKGFVLSHRGVRNVVDAPDKEEKIILLDAAALGNKMSTEDLLQTAVKVALPKKAVETGAEENARCAVKLTTYLVTVNYKCFTMPEILKAILPQGVVPLSGFEQVGHIAHVNLTPSHLPFRHIIGQVIVDCNPTVKTVVNKIDSISSVFREFKMEVIAGQDNLLAEVRQYGCVFRIPYDKVYWNSRLGHEHQRLVGLMKPGDELFDVMAGVGPFAVPASLKGVKVHANDLNPECAEAMRQNAALNETQFDIYNMDGRDFIVMVCEKFLSSVLPDGGKRHMSMNLPALAVAFLDAFRKPQWRSSAVVDKWMTIHCYTFSAENDPKADAVRQVEDHLGCKLPQVNLLGTHLVRDVAPTKQMVCVSFTLPEAIFTEPASKKLRSEV